MLAQGRPLPSTSTEEPESELVLRCHAVKAPRERDYKKIEKELEQDRTL
jgi:hypothetical protein